MDEYVIDHCEECSALGDDYFVDTTGELVDACIYCPFNPSKWDED